MKLPAENNLMIMKVVDWFSLTGECTNVDNLCLY